MQLERKTGDRVVVMDTAEARAAKIVGKTGCIKGVTEICSIPVARMEWDDGSELPTEWGLSRLALYMGADPELKRDDRVVVADTAASRAEGIAGATGRIDEVMVHEDQAWADVQLDVPGADGDMVRWPLNQLAVYQGPEPNDDDFVEPDPDPEAALPVFTIAIHDAVDDKPMLMNYRFTPGLTADQQQGKIVVTPGQLLGLQIRELIQQHVARLQQQQQRIVKAGSMAQVEQMVERGEQQRLRRQNFSRKRV